MPLSTAYLAIGSNLGDRLANMREALRQLEAPGDLLVLQAGRIYENRAIGMGEAAPFLNTVIEVKTALEPEVLLERCLRVEDQLGRVRTGVWAPRTLDLDVLLYDDLRMESATLRLPHPSMLERDFVMLPLRDVATVRVLAGMRVADRAKALESEELSCLSERIWTNPQVRMIAAVASNRVIGKDGHLPWSIAEDWELFLKKTLGGILIMGRLSFMEMVKEPTWKQDRTYWVVTSQPELVVGYGVVAVAALSEALEATQGLKQPIWICGGSSIYAEGLNCADQLHLTRVEGDFVGDTYFPGWADTFRKQIASVASSDTDHAYRFEVYEK
jgi:2-amino-4-hydroxy-6-hydroxymethyldihydropteridine diphosphokinase